MNRTPRSWWFAPDLLKIESEIPNTPKAQYDCDFRSLADHKSSKTPLPTRARHIVYLSILIIESNEKRFHRRSREHLLIFWSVLTSSAMLKASKMSHSPVFLGYDIELPRLCCIAIPWNIHQHLNQAWILEVSTCNLFSSIYRRVGCTSAVDGCA